MKRFPSTALFIAIALAGCSSDNPETKTAQDTSVNAPATGTVGKQEQTPKKTEQSATTKQTGRKQGVTGRVVGKVGDHLFTEKDIDAAFGRMPENFRKMKGNPAMRANILNNLMTRYALTAKARQMGIAEEPQVRRRIDDAISAILLQELNKRQRVNLVDDDEKKLRAYYDTHATRFAQPETVHVRHILVKNKKTAKKILRKLKRGADFAALAKRYSEDQGSSARGGDIGSFPRGSMAPAFEKASFALTKDGALTGPVKTKFGYHIIQRLGHTPAGKKPFEQVRDQIRREMQQQAFRQWVERVKKEMGLTILDPRYQRGMPRPLPQRPTPTKSPRTGTSPAIETH